MSMRRIIIITFLCSVLSLAGCQKTSQVSASSANANASGEEPEHVPACRDWFGIDCQYPLSELDAVIKQGANVNKIVNFSEWNEQTEEYVEVEATPVLCAALRGDDAAVSHLVKAGAMINGVPDDENCLPPLLTAIKVKNPKAVEILIKAGADVNLLYRDGRSDAPLSFAAEMLDLRMSNADSQNVLDIILLLIQAGADVNSQAGHRVFWDLIGKKGNEKVIQAMLDRGIDPQVRNSQIEAQLWINHEQTFLIHAAQEKDSFVVDRLIEKGIDINAVDAQGATALYYASQNNNIEMVRHLIEAGADIDVADKYGDTALDEAVLNKNYEIARLLLEKGNQKDISKAFCTAFCTWDESSYQIARLLYEKGANIHACGLGNGYPMYCAAFHNDIEILDKLIQADKDIPNSENQIALSMALSKGHIEAANHLLQAGYDVNRASPKDGGTPLMFAVKNADVDGMNAVISELLKRGANVNSKSEFGYTALMIALKFENAEIVKQLLAKGANVNDMNNEGETVIMYAAHSGNADIIHLLLEKGANVGAVSKSGKTVLMYASESGNADVVRMLLARKDIKKTLNTKDNIGKTALIYARSAEVVRVLLDAGASVVLEREDSFFDLNVLAHIARMDGAQDLIPRVMQLLKDANQNDLDNIRDALRSAAGEHQIDNVRAIFASASHLCPDDPTAEDSITLNDATYQCEPQILQMFLDAGCRLDENSEAKGNILKDMAELIKLRREHAQTLDEKGVNLDNQKYPNESINSLWNKRQSCLDILKPISPKLSDRESAMLLSTYIDDPEILKFLIAQGANVNANLGEQDSYPMMRAIFENNTESMDVLYANGYDPKQQPVEVFAGCFIYGDMDMIRLCVTRGVDVNRRDDEGRTLLMYASLMTAEPGLKALVPEIKASKIIQIVKLLIELGADVNARDNSGKTALWYATHQSNVPQVREILISAGAKED